MKANGFLLLIVPVSFQFFRKDVDRFFMGFFRDLARFKARRRRLYGNRQAIVAISDVQILFGVDDDPLQDVVRNEVDVSLPFYSETELLDYVGKDDQPILISIYNKIFDVSTGTRFYGPKGKYHIFAGRDLTYALSTACLLPSCMGRDKQQRQEELTRKQVSEGKRWMAFFETHDAYPYVGNMEEEGRGVDALIENLIDHS